MAKRDRRAAIAGSGQDHSPESTAAPTSTKMEEFAEDLGRLLGNARAKAEGWLGQRHNVAKQLEQIRDTATSLLTQLGDATIRRRGRRPGPQGPRKNAQGARATASGAYPRRKLSAKAREAISRAQKK